MNAQRMVIDTELTIYTASEWKDRLLGAFGESEVLELDLGGVTDIDSAGMQLLVLLKIEAVAHGKTLAVVNHSRAVLDLLALYDLERFFGDPVVVDTQEASA